METLKNAWINLEAVGFYPWVSIAALGVYFVMRAIMGYEKGKAVPFVLLGCAIGQLYYAFPKDAPGIVGVLFFALLQTVVSIGIYSFAEYFGLIDRLGKLAQKKMDEKGGGNGSPPA